MPRQRTMRPVTSKAMIILLKPGNPRRWHRLAALGRGLSRDIWRGFKGFTLAHSISHTCLHICSCLYMHLQVSRVIILPLLPAAVKAERHRLHPLSLPPQSMEPHPSVINSCPQTQHYTELFLSFRARPPSHPCLLLNTEGFFSLPKTCRGSKN